MGIDGILRLAQILLHLFDGNAMGRKNGSLQKQIAQIFGGFLVQGKLLQIRQIFFMLE